MDKKSKNSENAVVEHAKLYIKEYLKLTKEYQKKKLQNLEGILDVREYCRSQIEDGSAFQRYFDTTAGIVEEESEEDAGVPEGVPVPNLKAVVAN